ncbi:FAD-dependent oxidoreductase [Arcobacter roscoffensis]|uniref:FAD-dependent oxidoreductase n=1 Tax=Arcobacter roscoffensis TaxID=2961520 RepID=A0ABY5E137_9BACT|nr:FAD-dependent oxidoreductase [Arcobacter roscoffensis]UTJ05436.1 FAD-dependent oxidoreductase [Arcobacter roscoffensis]
MSEKIYDYVVLGAGVAGSFVSNELKKHTKNLLLIDRNSDVGFGASGAAGAFLSPLLGKDNKFKSLITKALKYSTNFYKENLPSLISHCGTCRIPKNDEDRQKFESYKPFMDFDYEELEDGYFFPIGSQVDSYEVCKSLTKDIKKLLSYEVTKIEKVDGLWLINDEIKTKNLILTTGANIDLIDEEYFNIRAVWGQRINILSSTKVDINYHKECSLSKSKPFDNTSKNLISIGATHNRFEDDMSGTCYDLKTADFNHIEPDEKSLKLMNEDTSKLLNLANDIKKLNDVELLDVKIGARASSVDYFPMLGKLVDSKKSIEKFPHILNGSFIKKENLEMIDNLYVLNGVGGRGFVLSPYLARQLVEHIINKKEISEDIETYRLFTRWAKRLKNKKK